MTKSRAGVFWPDTRDERDSPRGRIYLLKQLLETGEASEHTHTHLDRCLSCRSCETTCPSGVAYGQLLDIGRGVMARDVPRPARIRLVRSTLRAILSRPRLFGCFVRLGRVFAPILPATLRSKIPPEQASAPTTVTNHARKMLILEGCVQSSAAPNTNAVTRRVLDRLGISLVDIPKAGCCGAVNYHLAAHSNGLDDMRRNIDAWWPSIEEGAEAIVSTASGCGAMLDDYGNLLAGDPAYAMKALRISEMNRDITEILLEEDLAKLSINTGVGKIAVHTPCTLHHALNLADAIPEILGRVGFELAKTSEQQLCCGSAGTYSILQPKISGRLREKKLRALSADAPSIIATGNIGCQLHLGEKSDIPVIHWIELFDQD